MCSALADVCLVPIADIDLFDHLVGRPRLQLVKALPVLQLSREVVTETQPLSLLTSQSRLSSEDRRNRLVEIHWAVLSRNRRSKIYNPSSHVRRWR